MAIANDPQGEGSTVPLKRRFLGLPTIISFAIAIAFIAFLLTRFDIDVLSTWEHVKDSNPGFLALAFGIYYLTFPVRGYRWRLLLRNVGTFKDAAGGQPSLPSVSVMILLSWFANSVTWFRLGDALRAYILTNKFKASFPRTIGTVAAERLLDIGVVFSLLLLASIGLLREETSDTTKSVTLAASVLAAVGAATLLAMRICGLRAARFLPGRLQLIYGRFQEGTLGSFRNLPLLLVLSMVIWLVEAARLFFVMEALGFEVALSMILFAALAHSLLTTIPLTPGGLGFVELGLTGLLALSLTRGEAASVTLLDRSITYLSIVVIGGAAFAIRQFFEMRRHRPEEPHPEPG